MWERVSDLPVLIPDFRRAINDESPTLADQALGVLILQTLFHEKKACRLRELHHPEIVRDPQSREVHAARYWNARVLCGIPGHSVPPCLLVSIRQSNNLSSKNIIYHKRHSAGPSKGIADLSRGVKGIGIHRRKIIHEWRLRRNWASLDHLLSRRRLSQCGKGRIGEWIIRVILYELPEIPFSLSLRILSVPEE